MSVKKWDLSSRVIRVDTGALTAFHRILSDDPIDKKTFTLRTLCCAIPWINAELGEAFGVTSSYISVTPRVDGIGRELASIFEFTFKPNSVTLQRRLSRAAIERAMPKLTSAYQLGKHTRDYARYESVRRWSVDEYDAAQRTHRANGIKFINWGGHQVAFVIREPVHLDYVWYHYPRVHVLPTLTAAILLSFAMSSVYRYRPAVVQKLEISRISLLLDVFSQEACEYVMASLRSLLFMDELIMTPGPR